MTSPNRPADETGPPADCPDWCNRVHSEGDHREDQHHRSPATVIPAIVTSIHPDSQFDSTATSLVIQILRPHDGEDDWVLIGDAEHWENHLALSPETTRRLVAILVDIARAG